MSTDVTSPPLTAPSDAPRASGPANRPIWQLVLGAIAVVALLWWLGGWAVPFVIFAIVAMVVVHELGHFLTARWTGMKATEFFVGFGPRLWSKRVGETEYGLKAIVIGGYVRILGMTTNEELEADDEPRSFRQASFPRRVLVASAGSIMHLLMALVLAWSYVAFVGLPTTENQIAGFTKWVGVAHNAAQAAGLERGDRIITVDGRAEPSFTDLQQVIEHSVGRPLRLVVERHGRRIHLRATPVSGRDILVREGHKIVRLSAANDGYLGVELESASVSNPVSALRSAPDAVGLIGSYLWQVLDATYHIFSPSGLSSIVHADVNSKVATSHAFVTHRPLSIYGIAHAAVQIAYQNPANLLLIFMLINLGIGTINMLPMLPLDGGYVAVALYERLRTRRGQPRYHADVNKLAPVVYAFLAILLVVFFSALYLDVAHPLQF
jgi:membrane-associated protease RseP (regulator of RpoE activity)